MSSPPILPASFYARSTLIVAREMLGKLLVHTMSDGQKLSGRIVETEAYMGPGDRASHAHRGVTKRTEVMFGPPGRAYVYLVYGMHCCFNAVTEQEGYPGAVLVRGVEVLEGDSSGEHRTGAGPGLVCRALRIDRRCNRMSLSGGELVLEDTSAVADECVAAGPRINVAYASEWAALPWRFWLPASAAVSRRGLGQPFSPGIISAGPDTLRSLEE